VFPFSRRTPGSRPPPRQRGRCYIAAISRSQSIAGRTVHSPLHNSGIPCFRAEAADRSEHRVWATSVQAL
jgi:hypothetical protein